MPLYYDSVFVVFFFSVNVARERETSGKKGGATDRDGLFSLNLKYSRRRTSSSHSLTLGRPPFSRRGTSYATLCLSQSAEILLPGGFAPNKWWLVAAAAEQTPSVVRGLLAARSSRLQAGLLPELARLASAVSRWGTTTASQLAT